MALTKSFKELVQRRVSQDPEFATALLREGIDTMLTGDMDAGKAILRDYVKATVGFEKLDEATATLPKSLIRMVGPRGNPQASPQPLRHHSLPAKAGRCRVPCCRGAGMTQPMGNLHRERNE
jgi:hypothetical protein